MRVIPRRRRRSSEDRTMTIVEHLEELRKRLIISLAAVGVASIVGFVFYGRIFQFVLGPYRDALRAIPAGSRPPGALRDSLIATSPTEPFLTFLKIRLFSGFLVALPVILYQVWRFITPRPTRRGGGGALPS